MSQPATVAKNIVADSASAVEGFVTELRDAAQSRVDDVVSRVRKTGFETVLKSRAYVEENPLQALAVAFGVGYVLKTLRPGFLFTVALLATAGYAGTRFAPR